MSNDPTTNHNGNGTCQTMKADQLQWFYHAYDAQGGRACGPLSLAKVREAYSNGDLKDADMVWHTDNKQPMVALKDSPLLDYVKGYKSTKEVMLEIVSSHYVGSLPELPLEFRGSAREYFRIWIVNLCLTLVTCGVFSAWAKVRKKRYTYSHTILGGTPFQYLGQPIPILKGRIIAALGFGIYYVSSHFITSLLPYVLAAGLIVAPWVLVRSAGFNARYSAFRNMTFHFDGGYWDTLEELSPWALLAVLVVGAMFFGIAATAIVSGIATFLFALSFPWFIRRLKKLIVEHTSYGGKKGTFFATGSQFFGIYFVSGLIGLAVAIPTVILMTALLRPTKNVSWFLVYLGLAPMYAGYVLGYAYLKARSGNLVWNHTRLGPLRFQSTLRCGGLLRLYVTNGLGIAGSLGLLIPWAVIRTLKYRADNLRVRCEGELTEFQGSDRSAVAAAAAETMDFFDVDLSL